LDVDPLLREEEVAQGSVAIGATLCGKHQRLFDEGYAPHVCIDLGVHVLSLFLSGVFGDLWLWADKTKRPLGVETRRPVE
jgi:hypothetical protein